MIQGGQRFFQGGQSGMNSLLAPGLHPFSPHFSPQKSGKPETVSVNLWMRKTERILSVETSCLGDDLSLSSLWKMTTGAGWAWGWY